MFIKMKYKNKLLFFTAVIAMILWYSVCAWAADSSMHIVLAPGRNMVLIEKDGSAAVSSITKGKTLQDTYCMPIEYENQLMIPLEFLKLLGYSLETEQSTGGITITNKESPFFVWNKEGMKLECRKAVLKDNLYSFYTTDGVIKKIETNTKVLFRTSFIPVEDLEQFGFVIFANPSDKTVELYHNATAEFDELFQKMILEKDTVLKQALIDTYVGSQTPSQQFIAANQKYSAMGTEYDNGTNGGLAVQINAKQYFANLSGRDTIEGAFTTKLYSTQLCYSYDDEKQYLYFVNPQDCKLYRAEVKDEGLGEEIRVKLPGHIENKNISQLVSFGGMLYFVVYDNAEEGGLIYRAKTGNEAATTVRVSSDKAWNLSILPDNKLYYISFNHDFGLYSIDLKQYSTVSALMEQPNAGVKGIVENYESMQCAAFDKENLGTYYYSSRQNGAVYMVSPNSAGIGERIEIVPPQTELVPFMNAGTYKGNNVLVYISYPKGKWKNFADAQIKLFSTSKDVFGLKTIYTGKEAVMLLSMLNNNLYFLNINENEIYELDIQGSQPKIKKK